MDDHEINVHLNDLISEIDRFLSSKEIKIPRRISEIFAVNCLRAKFRNSQISLNIVWRKTTINILLDIINKHQLCGSLDLLFEILTKFIKETKFINLDLFFKNKQIENPNAIIIEIIRAMIKHKIDIFYHYAEKKSIIKLVSYASKILCSNLKDCNKTLINILYAKTKGESIDAIFNLLLQKIEAEMPADNDISPIVRDLCCLTVYKSESEPLANIISHTFADSKSFCNIMKKFQFFDDYSNFIGSLLKSQNVNKITPRFESNKQFKTDVTKHSDNNYTNNNNISKQDYLFTDNNGKSYKLWLSGFNAGIPKSVFIQTLVNKYKRFNVNIQISLIRDRRAFSGDMTALVEVLDPQSAYILIKDTPCFLSICDMTLHINFLKWMPERTNWH